MGFIPQSVSMNKASTDEGWNAISEIMTLQIEMASFPGDIPQANWHSRQKWGSPTFLFFCMRTQSTWLPFVRSYIIFSCLKDNRSVLPLCVFRLTTDACTHTGMRRSDVCTQAKSLRNRDLLALLQSQSDCAVLAAQFAVLNHRVSKHRETSGNACETDQTDQAGIWEANERSEKNVFTF